MIECRNLTYIYEVVEFGKILKDFSKAYYSKKYPNKIPYCDWKKLTDNDELDIIEIEYTQTFNGKEYRYLVEYNIGFKDGKYYLVGFEIR